MKFMFFISLCFLPLLSKAYTPNKLYKLTILHTNDHHGRFWPNRDGELGLAARATLIKKIRSEVASTGGHLLLLDAGDINTGTPTSDLLDAEPDFMGMSLLKYDVMAVGNHEFDNPLETIKKQNKWAGFPFISANIYDNKGKRIFPSHIRKNLDELKVTIFGLTTEDTPLKTNPLNVKGLQFIPAVQEAKKLVPIIKNNTDVLIALTHIGHYPNEKHGADAPGDVTLARKVPGIDLIIGGHTQKPLFKPDIQNQTIIAQAHEWGKYVGRIDLEFFNGKLKLKNFSLIPINLKDSGSQIEQDQEVTNFLTPYKKAGDKSLQVKLGFAETEFIGRREVIRNQETNLGNLIAKAYQTKFNADLAILNSGGVRDSIYKGDITYETILMVLPFQGEVVTAKLSGKELKNYLSQVIFNLTPGSGAFPQMYGVEALVNRKSKKIMSLKINGQELSDSKFYTIALPEFIANGGDKFPKIIFSKYGYVDADILKEYVEKLGELKLDDYRPTHYIQETNVLNLNQM